MAHFLINSGLGVKQSLHLMSRGLPGTSGADQISGRRLNPRPRFKSEPGAPTPFDTVLAHITYLGASLPASTVSTHFRFSHQSDPLIQGVGLVSKSR
jgi:hypothetical protein